MNANDSRERLLAWSKRLDVSDMVAIKVLGIALAIVLGIVLVSIAVAPVVYKMIDERGVK